MEKGGLLLVVGRAAQGAMGQVGMGGGRLDQTSKAVSTLVVQPQAGRAFFLVLSQSYSISRTHTRSLEHTDK